MQQYKYRSINDTPRKQIFYRSLHLGILLKNGVETNSRHDSYVTAYFPTAEEQVRQNVAISLNSCYQMVKRKPILRGEEG